MFIKSRVLTEKPERESLKNLWDDLCYGVKLNISSGAVVTLLPGEHEVLVCV